MNKPASPVVIIGCGDIGTQVAKTYLKNKQKIQAIIQSKTSHSKLFKLGIDAFMTDLSQPFNNPLNSENCQLYLFAPPPSQGTTDTHTKHLIQALDSSGKLPQRIVYISTTGVYGDCQGRWINEEEPVKPQADRAKRRLDAEQQLLSWSKQTGVDIIILRVAGIYGPNKLPLERLRQKQPVIRASESPITNRIHSTDLVNIAITAMERGKAGEIYNVCDSAPGTMADYFKQIAIKANLPIPAEISLSEGNDKLSAGMMSYMRESRRLSNKKMLHELDITLLYPTLEKGLNSCFS